MEGNMSEYDELVKRLRHDADAVNQPGGTLSPEHWRDAACAIEALVGEVDRLKAALVEQVKQYPDYSDICRKVLEAKP